MAKKIKVSILNFDLSDNSLGRAYIIYKALERYYDVKILGPMSSNTIWDPVKNDADLKYQDIKLHQPIKSLKSIDGDVIYAIKPKGTSFGYGLLVKCLKDRPLILDIDDWEYGSFLDFRTIGKLYSLARFWDINNILFTRTLDSIAKITRYKTVSNTFLQMRFGGTLIPHFRDTNAFDPDNFNSEELKRKLGLNGKKIILFMGTPRKHKGIDELILATEKLDRSDLVLLIVGASDEDKRRLPKKPFLKVYGRQPFKEIPNFLAIADLIVLFQSKSMATKGQLPAKVFDAMSMARSIIASGTSDLPKILDGCGEIVEPGDIDSLVEKMKLLLDNPTYAKELGRKARIKCINEYSYDAIAPRLHAVVEDALANVRQTANK